MHQTSPHYPKSNGLAESAVKSAKKLLRRCWDVHRGRIDEEECTRGVLQQRNTPGTSGRSPAEIVFGRPLRDDLPIHPSSFDSPPSRPPRQGGEEPRAQTQQRAPCREPRPAQEDRREACRQSAKQWYDQHTRDLPEFPVGTRVRVQDVRTKRWDRCGVVTQVSPYRRYRVRFEDGGEVERNRCHLRRRYALSPVSGLADADGGGSRLSPGTTRPDAASSRPASDGARGACPEAVMPRRSTR